MPSPDVAGYLGLDLVPGVSAETLLAAALANMALSYPEWTPREGNTEVVLLEEVAAMTEEIVYAINLLPAGMTEVLLRTFGAERDAGQPPSFSLMVTVGADYVAQANTIPAGTVFEVTRGDVSLNFTTVATVTSTPGTVDMFVTVYAGEATSALNGTAAFNGGTIALVDSLAFAESVGFDENVAGGRDPEDSAAFIARAIPLLSRLTTTLIRPVDVEAYVAALVDVVRVKVVDLYSPALPAEPGQNPGYVTVYLAGDNGTALSTDRLEEVRVDLEARMHAGVTVATATPTVTLVDVNITVLKYGAAVTTAVRAAVTAQLAGYIDPNTWPWLNTVRVNELIAAADQAPGVDTVLAVTQQRHGEPGSLAAADLTIPGVAPLAKLGTVTVTVVGSV